MPAAHSKQNSVTEAITKAWFVTESISGSITSNNVLVTVTQAILVFEVTKVCVHHKSGIVRHLGRAGALKWHISNHAGQPFLSCCHIDEALSKAHKWTLREEARMREERERQWAARVRGRTLLKKGHIFMG